METCCAAITLYSYVAGAAGFEPTLAFYQKEVSHIYASHKRADKRKSKLRFGATHVVIHLGRLLTPLTEVSDFAFIGLDLGSIVAVRFSV